MNNAKNNEIATLELINQVAFRHFLENGYEATNLRKICDEIGIKAASLYFYYKSKSDLFYYILKEIGDKQLKKLQEVVEINNEFKPDEQLHMLFKHEIMECMNHCVDYKFKLRYRMFPTDELAEEIRNIYSDWQNREFNICKPVIRKYLVTIGLDEQENEKLFFHQFHRFLYSFVYEILISGIAIKEDLMEIHWKQFMQGVLFTMSTVED